MAVHGIERILKEMLEDARRRRTEDQDKAGEAFVLERGTVKDIVEANRRARESRSQR